MALTKVSGSILRDPLNLGEVSIGGTLTYEDVTNVDALGIGTFRTGIKVLAGGINAVGVVTATAFHGDGSALTGIAADKIFEGNTEVETIDTGSNGHVKFTTEGSERLRITSGGDLYMNGNAPTHSTSSGSIFVSPPSGNPSRGIMWSSTSDTHYVKLESSVIDGLVINGYSGVAFATGSRSNSTWAERIRIGGQGQIGIAGTDYGNSGQVLTSGGSGNTVSWSTISTDLVSDTSPQLGGNLDTNSYEISLDTSHAVYFGDSNELHIKYHGSHGQIIYTGNNSLQNKVKANSYFQVVNNDTGDNIIEAQAGGKLSLWHAGSKKFETSSTGFTCSGTLNTSAVHTTASQGAVSIGGGGDIRLTNGSWTGDHAGKIQHANNRVYIQGGTDTYGHVFRDHGGGDRLYIDSNGHVLPADDNTYDLGLSTKRWRNLYTTDLQLSNKGSTNDVDGTWGNYTIQEGESDLFLINNRNGKKYKFNLTEVS